MTDDAVQDLMDSTPLKTVENVRGETLTYRVFHPTNQKLRLLVLPGYGGQGDVLAAELAVHLQDHCIIGVNPRGFGISTLNQRVYDHKENAIDLSIFLEKLGIDQTMVLGFSSGGCMAAYLTLLFPEKVTACVLYSSIPMHGIRFPKLNSNGMPEDSPRFSITKQDFEEHCAGLEALGMHSNDEEACRTIWNLSCGGGSDWMPPVGSAAMKRFHESAQHHRCRVGCTLGNARFNITPIQTPTSAPSDLLSKLQCPMIVLHGTNDAVISPSIVKSVTTLAMEEQWAPKGLLSYYEHDLGHFSHMIDAAKFVAVYRQALHEQVLDKKMRGLI